jgi:gliding motility-associated-like protein
VPIVVNPRTSTAPLITGYPIQTIEDSVLNICIPIRNTQSGDILTPSVCGVQNGTISNVGSTNDELCFRYTPTFGYRGEDTLCLRICNQNNQCDTALFFLNITARNNRFDCRNDQVPPKITLTHPLLDGVENGDTLSFSCVNPPLFTVNDARAVDNSDRNPRLRFVDIGVRQGHCQRDGFKVLMECDWIATDSCGNESRFKIFVKITDNVAPTLTGIPTNLSINSDNGETIPSVPNTIRATDNCGVATVSFNERTQTTVGCDYDLIRTWTATDECGNQTSRSQVITVRRTCPCLPPDAWVQKTDAACGDANGTARIIIRNDTTLNYTYVWSDGRSTSPNRTGLAAGTYHVTVSRLSPMNCTTALTFVINNDNSNCCTPPTATVTKTDATCGNANGSATIQVDNVANYTFAWSSNAPVAGVNPNIRTNMAAGTYSVTISRISPANCSTVVSVTIGNDNSNCCTPPSAYIQRRDATCGNANGYANVAVDNPANYTFTWSNGGGSTQSRSSLAAGSYTVTISRLTPANCAQVLTFNILNDTSNCCTDFIAATSLVQPVQSCQSNATICIETTANIALASLNGTTINFSICTGGVSVSVPVGTHTLVLKNAAGCLDSIGIKVVCYQLTPIYVDTTVLVGARVQHCLNSGRLAGSRFRFTVTKLTNENAVQFGTIAGTLCAHAEATNLGTERAIYVVIDEFGLKDTTIFTMTAVSRISAARIHAVDDYVTTRRNTDVMIDVFTNDTVRGILKSMRILRKPKFGDATKWSDNHILYLPKGEFCGDDIIVYELCSTTACDTATIHIKVLCDKLRIYNGFSPNGDGLNDNFVIEGIEEFPDNVLTVYNRWGSVVHTVKSYKNDWQGTWDGTNLPDGTYFYRLDDGKGGKYSGYVQIQR